ncbi:hypothetical protein cce_3859 [Crocosphaera subtropica ATCC 51142]|uniref:Uncharacterized protein n=1 Tax=Crocosphaera subtropica (strain ATCC 51142 / BH68) TaxID=43989 RepID=B1WP28_CROS5|nr:hypothetical protein cce_3859 [Crocosphaera subtropica ATCC 51142]
MIVIARGMNNYSSCLFCYYPPEAIFKTSNL